MNKDPKVIADLAKQGRLVEAAFLYDGSFAYFERDMNYLKFGVQIFFEIGRRERCLELLERISRLSPIDLKSALFVLHNYERINANKALALCAEHFSTIFPNSIQIQSEYARILQTTGHFGKASRVFERILKNFGEDAQIYRMHVISVHGRDLKSPFIKNMEKLWNRKNLSTIDRINLGFALGKVFDDLADYQKATHYLKIANENQAKLYPYNFEERVSEAKMFLAAQKGAHKFQTALAAEFTPVFMSGMPRSGTTVIENQLLQSGGFKSVGESSIAHRAAYKFFLKEKELVGIKDASHSMTNDFGRYCDAQFKLRVSKISPAILDKSMRNFLVSGYLISFVPGARIFFIDRNPLDIAQSLYRNYFKLGSHRYSNRTDDMAREIAIYDVVTERFSKVLEGDISRVSYEDFVTDPSRVINEMKSWAGVTDETQDLETGREQQSIKTLSVYQARQPVHAGRVSAWRKYGEIFEGFSEVYELARLDVEKKLKPT